MVKTLKNPLNQESDDLETWYIASDTQVLPYLYKWGYLVDLDNFYDFS